MDADGCDSETSLMNLASDNDYARDERVTRIAETSPAAGGSRSDRELLALLVGSVVDYAIFVLDPEGRIASWNPGAERIKGYRADEIIGQHFSRFYSPEDVAAGKPSRGLAIAAAEGRFEDEGWRIRKDGSRFWADVVITALRDATGELRGYAKVTRDLTERKQAEDRARLLAEAEAANRAKDEFMAILGHELRNPLAPIVTALELMRLRAPDVVRREREIIERQARYLARLVDDLLDVSRITQGKVSLHRSRVDINAAVTRAVELAEPLIAQRRHHLELRVAPEIYVDGDMERLTQILTNLLMNAAKYTPPGGRIVVRVKSEEGVVVIRVIDDGQGIEPDLLPLVFDRFTQAIHSIDRSGGGLGLGLAIVRGLVGLHGGSVTAESEGPGRGSTVTVRLPEAAPRARTISGDLPRTARRTQKARRILVVDDNEDTAVMLQDLLQELGHEVVVALDGPRALAAASKFLPDLALLDIGLPVMDGYELARLLRAAPGLGGVLLVAITGYGRDHDRARALDAGFWEHLVKLVDVGRLREIVQSPLLDTSGPAAGCGPN
jgi:PAS domain S-box-containing protein